MRALARTTLLFLTLVPTAASATETITYTYDARGRLVQVVHSGTVNNGVATSYTIDKADNRTNKTTTAEQKETLLLALDAFEEEEMNKLGKSDGG